MSVLWLTTVLPDARRGGGEVVSRELIDLLRRVHGDVHVLGYLRPGDDAPRTVAERCVGRRPIETAEAGLHRVAWLARAFGRNLPYSVAKYHSRSYRLGTREDLRTSPSVVVADHAQVAFALSEVPPGIPVLFVAHNVEGAVYRSVSANGAGPVAGRILAREARLIGALEAGLARRAAQVWTLTADDAAGLRALAPRADIRTLEAASRLTPRVGAGSDTCDVALLGSWTWEANAHGLQWFSAEVVPRLPGHLRVSVAGGGAECLRGVHPNVAVQGPVPDAGVFLCGSRVIAVPAVSGGGVQVKTLDAIATGLPVVATSAAVRGLSDLPASVTVAANGADFAEALRGRSASPLSDRMRLEALAWSRQRRQRLSSQVAGWFGELVEMRGSSPAGPAGR